MAADGAAGGEELVLWRFKAAITKAAPTPFNLYGVFTQAVVQEPSTK